MVILDNFANMASTVKSSKRPRRNFRRNYFKNYTLTQPSWTCISSCNQIGEALSFLL